MRVVAVVGMCWWECKAPSSSIIALIYIAVNSHDVTTPTVIAVIVAIGANLRDWRKLVLPFLGFWQSFWAPWQLSSDQTFPAHPDEAVRSLHTVGVWYKLSLLSRKVERCHSPLVADHASCERSLANA